LINTTVKWSFLSSLQLQLDLWWLESEHMRPVLRSVAVKVLVVVVPSLTFVLPCKARFRVLLWQLEKVQLVEIKCTHERRMFEHR
jgi:membrane protein YdbS with pleckstrin-like domain